MIIQYLQVVTITYLLTMVINSFKFVDLFAMACLLAKLSIQYFKWCSGKLKSG